MKNPFSYEIYKQRRISKEYPIRGEYFRDQTAILHSMEFRRLKHKTQVFFAPENDHVCTRIEHVLHVATIAASICKGLNKFGWELDPEMAYAIGLGHDLGHAPFGHTGEDALCEILQIPNGFIHEIHSYKVAEHLSQEGNGLNLTFGVLDGIICHCGETFEQSLSPSSLKKDLDTINSRAQIPNSYEGCIIRFADKIAYLGRDLEDALMVEDLIDIKQLPKHIAQKLGNKNGEIINHLVLDVIENSKNAEQIQFSDELYILMKDLKDFNYKFIYNHPRMLEYREYCKNIIKNLFQHFYSLVQKHGSDFEKYSAKNLKVDRTFGIYFEKMKNHSKLSGHSDIQIIVYYIAGMTDQFAMEAMKQISLPKPITFIK
jgi:dGTPase